MNKQKQIKIMFIKKAKAITKAKSTAFNNLIITIEKRKKQWN